MGSLLSCCLWLTLHVGSWHSSPQFSNDTYGAGLSVDVSKATRILAGDYRNSYRENTTYAGASYFPLGDKLKFGGFAVYASGYKQHLGFNALAGGMLEYEVSERVRVTLIGIPPAVDHLGGVVSLMVQFKLKE